VIAHSIRNLRIAAGTAANFALRRQIRLDPPYWLCVLLTLILMVVAAKRSPSSVCLPTLSTVLANLSYTQGIGGVPSIVRVSWTLCLEVQFYVAFIAIVWFSQKFRRKQMAEVVLLSFLAVISLAWTFYRPATPWFIGTWYLFALGVLGYGAFTRRAPHACFFAITLMALAIGATRIEGTATFVGPITALLIFTVGRLGHLSHWLAAPIFKYFAAISYSLYLVHFDLVSLVFRAGTRLTGNTIVGALVTSLIAVLVAVGAAHLLWFTIERPTIRLASRLKKKPLRTLR
jgi:peptidoglycan/LPS O-acetylase OafA/YrhL